MPRQRPRPTPWFAPSWNGWHHPDPNNNSALSSPRSGQVRSLPCALCGAPPKAQCVTKRGDLYQGAHKVRARAYNASSAAT